MNEKALLDVYWLEFQEEEAKLDALPPGDERARLREMHEETRGEFPRAYAILEIGSRERQIHILDQIEEKVHEVRIAIRNFRKNIEN